MSGGYAPLVQQCVFVRVVKEEGLRSSGVMPHGFDPHRTQILLFSF